MAPRGWKDGVSRGGSESHRSTELTIVVGQRSVILTRRVSHGTRAIKWYRIAWIGARSKWQGPQEEKGGLDVMDAKVLVSTPGPERHATRTGRTVGASMPSGANSGIWKCESVTHRGPRNKTGTGCSRRVQDDRE